MEKCITVESQLFSFVIYFTGTDGTAPSHNTFLYIATATIYRALVNNLC